MTDNHHIKLQYDAWKVTLTLWLGFSDLFLLGLLLHSHFPCHPLCSWASIKGISLPVNSLGLDWPCLLLSAHVQLLDPPSYQPSRRRLHPWVYVSCWRGRQLAGTVPLRRPPRCSTSIVWYPWRPWSRQWWPAGILPTPSTWGWQWRGMVPFTIFVPATICHFC